MSTMKKSKSNHQNQTDICDASAMMKRHIVAEYASNSLGRRLRYLPGKNFK